ncbi:hypothetical protein GCM10022419_117610 [Nonomuraea rosea]|uniref:Uncharacterized protein n=1 Tax=Nonomuraea rosea TaxID=638574 RepID=A0ABP6ZKV1_9ACTN
MTGLPLSGRRALPEALFASVPAAGVLALGMHTTEENEARAWYDSLHTVGVEGQGLATPLTSPDPLRSTPCRCPRSHSATRVLTLVPHGWLRNLVAKHGAGGTGAGDCFDDC